MRKLRPRDSARDVGTACNCGLPSSNRDSALIRIDTVPTVIVIAGIGLSQMLADFLWVGNPSRMGALGMVYVGIAALLIIYALVMELVLRYQERKQKGGKVDDTQTAVEPKMEKVEPKAETTVTDAPTEALTVTSPPTILKNSEIAPEPQSRAAHHVVHERWTRPMEPTAPVQMPPVPNGHERWARPAEPTAPVQRIIPAPEHPRSIFDDTWMPPTPEILVAPEEDYRPRRAIETNW